MLDPIKGKPKTKTQNSLAAKTEKMLPISVSYKQLSQPGLASLVESNRQTKLSSTIELVLSQGHNSIHLNTLLNPSVMPDGVRTSIFTSCNRDACLARPS